MSNAKPNVRRVIRAARLCDEMGHPGDSLAAIDAMQAEIDGLRKGAISALAAGGVLIRLPRVEGYEDVCDELLAADALEGINWPSYEVLTAEEAKGAT